MAPRSFSTDGAQGAWGGNGASPGSGALGLGMMGGMGGGEFSNGALNGFGGAFQSGPSPTTTASQVPAGWTDTLPGFDDGGSMPDASGSGGGHDDLVGLALATVDSALQYGRQKYGLGGDMHQSPNVEDRRNDSDFGQSVTGPINNFASNAYDIYNRATGYGINPDDANNPVGQAAGVNNVDDPKNKTLQGLGDDGTLDDTQGGQ